MRVYVYKNRYSDVIGFEEHITNETSGYLVMSGNKFTRYAIDDSKTITMIDPSGGPYIELGQFLGFIDKELSHHKVTEISQNLLLEKDIIHFNIEK